jgi:hypothetical protein
VSTAGISEATAVDPTVTSHHAGAEPSAERPAGAEPIFRLVADVDGTTHPFPPLPAAPTPEVPTADVAAEAPVPPVGTAGVVIPAHPAAWIGGVTLLLAAAVATRLKRWLA